MQVKQLTYLKLLSFAIIHCQSMIVFFGSNHPALIKFQSQQKRTVFYWDALMFGSPYVFSISLLFYIFLDVAEEELFGGSLESLWEKNQLQYIGLIFLAPRLICLLILIFGMLTSSLFVCQMRIIQSIEPRKIVDAFGKVKLYFISLNSKLRNTLYP